MFSVPLSELHGSSKLVITGCHWLLVELCGSQAKKCSELNGSSKLLVTLKEVDRILRGQNFPVPISELYGFKRLKFQSCWSA
jgi:hypothetical protein